MFNYEDSDIKIPYKIEGQPDDKMLWFNDEEKVLTLKFEFPLEKKMGENQPPWYGKLIWRYTIEYVEDGDKRVFTTGYFKLDHNRQTELDLQYYGKFQVKWIRFTVFYVDNPQQRAWFSPIRGNSFTLVSGIRKLM